MLGYVGRPHGDVEAVRYIHCEVQHTVTSLAYGNVHKMLYCDHKKRFQQEARAPRLRPGQDPVCTTNKIRVYATAATDPSMVGSTLDPLRT